MRIHEFDVEASRKPTDTVARDDVAIQTAANGSQIIHYGGQQFTCSTEMAQIFLKHARHVIESGEPQLVPLLHSGGIELLLISRLTPYSLNFDDET